MSEIIQQEKIADAQEGRNDIEDDHAGIEKLMNSACAGVDEAGTEAIKRADERIDAGPESFGLDKTTGDEIFASGGFAERVDVLKGRITSLSTDAKTRISALSNGAAEGGSPVEAASVMPEEKAEAQKPMSLDRYMAERGRAEKFSDRMRERMQLAQLKIHRVKDAERVLGFAHYLEDNAANKEFENKQFGVTDNEEIKKVSERYKKQGYTVSTEKSRLDGENVEVIARKETRFKFNASRYEANDISELINAPTDPVAAIERMRELGYHLETFGGRVFTLKSEVQPILQAPNVLPFLEKLKAFGGTSVSQDFFNSRAWIGGNAFRGLAEFAAEDAEKNLLTDDAEKTIEHVSAALGRPVERAQLEMWLRLTKNEHVPDIVAALVKEEKTGSDLNVETVISRVNAIHDAGIEDVVAALSKDGFSISEMVEMYSGLSEKKADELRAAAKEFDANPRLLAAVRQADNVFLKGSDEKSLDPENLRYFSRVVEKMPEIGVAFAAMADLGVQVERYERGDYLRDVDRLMEHKDVLEALIQPDFKAFAARCESAGYKFSFKDFFAESGWDRTNLARNYQDERFRSALSSEGGIALAKEIGVFEAPASRWNIHAFEYLSQIPHALETVQKLQEAYGYKYNANEDSNNYSLQYLRNVMEDEGLRGKLLDPKIIGIFGRAKEAFGVGFSLEGAWKVVEIADDPTFQAALDDPEAIAFIKSGLKESNTDLRTAGALAMCDPTLRPAIRKIAEGFGYVPEARNETRWKSDPETGELIPKEELTLDGIDRLEKLRDNPRIFEAQEKLEAVGMRKNPLTDMESLEVVARNDLFPIFESTKNSPRVQDFLWRNLDAAASLAAMSPEKIPVYIEVFQKIDDSPSQEIQRVKDQLLSQLLESEHPIEDYQKIESIFIKNNIPTVGKIFEVFQALYDEERLDGMLKRSTTASPVLEHASSRRRYYTIYKDLLSIHIESGNRALKEYIEILQGGSGVLDKYERSGMESLAPREQEQIRYFVGKLETLLAKSALDTSEEAFEMAAASDFGERVKHVREGLKVEDGQTVLERISEMYLRPTGLTSLDQVLEKMREAKTGADARGRRMVATATEQPVDGKPSLNIQEGDLLKGVDDQHIASILQNGSVAKEFLGASSDSDATPLDTDLSIVLAGDLERGNASAIGNSIAAGYGALLFVVKDHGRFQRTEQGSNAAPVDGTRELFKTGVMGERHYGIRTGFATTEIDFMVARGSLVSNPRGMEKVFFEIAQNGFYIPIVDEGGVVVFTPEMYDERRKAFQGLEKFDGEALSFKQTTTDEPSYPAVAEIATALPEDSERVNEITQVIRAEMKKALEGLGVALRPEFDTSILGAELLDTGSTGRHTNTPGDFDFDLSLKLDAGDFTKARELAEAIKALMKMEKDDSHDEAGGYYQLRAKGVTEIGGVTLDAPLDIDIGFAKKSDLSIYGSHDAIRDKLDFIKEHDGDEAYKQTIANIILTKQILKEGHAYKKMEHGGIGGIGVENWVLANGGNLEAAFKNFRDAAYENGTRLPFQEFKQRYKILDAGVNIKYLNHDNFIDILKPEGYEAMLNTIDGYLSEQKE